MKHSIIFYLTLITLMNTQCSDSQTPDCDRHDIKWSTLPALPDTTGFAGSFAGVSYGALLVAGGSNFPDGGAPWKGSVKKWYDKIFVLENKESNWREAGKLPVPLGYGVSISTDNGLVIVGGSNEKGHVANVWCLQYKDGAIQTDSLPSLPFPLANTCGVLLNNKIYVAGGLVAPDSPATSNAFLVLDLSKPGSNWKTLPAWPGPSRMLAVAGAAEDRFYLFSGTQLVNGQRQYLQDAYVYKLDSGWKTLAPLPHAVVAAPSPAYYTGDHSWMIFGGDDGRMASQASELKEKHPGFNDTILLYDVTANRWQTNGKIHTAKKQDAFTHPNNSIWAPVTSPMVQWDDQLIFAGGEVRPATRTPNVLVAKPCE
jgi:N-acetylneuraminate epimerase